MRFTKTRDNFVEVKSIQLTLKLFSCLGIYLNLNCSVIAGHYRISLMAHWTLKLGNLSNF